MIQIIYTIFTMLERPTCYKLIQVILQTKEELRVGIWRDHGSNIFGKYSGSCSKVSESTSGKADIY